MVVCPLYQLPTRSSQIYQQAGAHNVCIFSYSHLSVLASFADQTDATQAQALLRRIFETIEAMPPTKDATAYWIGLNSAMLDFHPAISPLWSKEKLVTPETIEVSKEETLTYLAKERERVLKLSHEEAIKNLLDMHKFAARSSYVNTVTDNDILSI